MENKYFTPDIEDIRVGYECEYTPSSESKDGEKNWTVHWKHIIVDSKNIQYLFGANTFDQVRVPYLTKEQIEAEGWVETDSRSVFKKDKLNLGYAQPLNSSPLIWIRNSGDYVYQGECKDINTFRYICKLLNI